MLVRLTFMDRFHRRRIARAIARAHRLHGQGLELSPRQRDRLYRLWLKHRELFTVR